MGQVPPVSRKLPDPLGQIARIRAKLPKNCKIRQSPWVDHIIALRMQGVSYRQVEQFLIERGAKFRISAVVLCRSFNKVKGMVNIPLAEAMAEAWGGGFDLDLARELAGQIVLQRERVDHLSKVEKEGQKANERFVVRQIAPERALLVKMIDSLHGMMKDPMEAADELRRLRDEAAGESVSMTPDAEDLMAEMIIRGELRLGGSDEEEEPDGEGAEDS